LKHYAYFSGFFSFGDENIVIRLQTQGKFSDIWKFFEENFCGWGNFGNFAGENLIIR